MKRKLQILSVLILTSISSQIFGQSTVTFDLRCSADKASYELYITRSSTAAAPFTVNGSSRVTLVLPTGSRTITHTNESPVSYNPQPVITNPGSIGNDYYEFSGTAGISLIGVLTADVPTLWLTITPSDGTDQDARLFINGTDPDPTDPDLNGADLSNTFFTATIAGSINEYSGNVSDATINCARLSTSDITLEGFKVYPNPASDKIYIKGDISALTGIEVYSITGQLVKRKRLKQTNLTEAIDISALESSIYFVKLYGETGQRTIRLVKK